MNSTKGAAPEASMATLHDDLAKKLSTLIADGETIVVAGEEKHVKVSAAVLAVARGFLKDNDVTCDRIGQTSAVGELAEKVAVQDNVDAEVEGLRFVQGGKAG